MERKFTEAQQQAIELRNKNILVSAAAGSGKTAVLVERIIRMISEGEHPADIDRLLIVTYTNAAAGEMKERITEAIAEKLAVNPENAHLQRQSALIHNAQITTIHSFCLFVIRNHFQEIGLDPAFRVADEGETGLLMQEVLEEVLEEAFGELERKRGEDVRGGGTEAAVRSSEEAQPGAEEEPWDKSEAESSPFRALVEAYSTGKKETTLEEIILSLYRFAESYPWPFAWLKEHGEDYEIPSEEVLEQSPFMKYILNYLEHLLPELAGQLEYCIEICGEADGPYPYGENLEKSLGALQKACGVHTYGELQAALEGVAFDRLPAKKDESINPEKREIVKEIRADVKKQVEQLRELFFSGTKESHLIQCRQVSPVVRELAELTIRFGERFAEKKRKQNLIDFSDMEHLALEILCSRREQDGEVYAEPTEAALELRDYFEEIMIDEYQDSNLVQECILRCISGEEAGHYNRFMVGDVKQSIYKFRLARPELFMEKFYAYADGAEQKCRIDLDQNFRSRREVLESVNLIFSQLMASDLGGIDYDERAKLHYGAMYYEEESAGGICDREALNGEENYDEEPCNEMCVDGTSDGKRAGPNKITNVFKCGRETEFLIIEKEEEEKTALEQEAEVIAGRIRRLMRELRVLGEDKRDVRPLQYGDIVILLRNGSDAAEVFAEVLQRFDIPCFANSQTGYFENPEVQVVLQLLRVLDNPLQDIPLFGVLKSCFGGFTDVEIAKIAAAFPGRQRFYRKLKRYGLRKEEPADKCRAFSGWLEDLRQCAVWLSTRELLSRIMEESHYLEYVTAMPEGQRRRANAQMLLQKAEAFEKTNFKGLYHFVRYIDQIEKYDRDQGGAAGTGETADAVRVMTIHKSKGLEFPVCFVAGMGRKMNRRDSSAQVLTDMDMGIGVDQIDPLLRVRRRTLRKTALSRKILLDSQAEELRVLYVALTRAKEKLIITGVTDDAEKLLRGKIYIASQRDRVLPYRLRSGAGSFLELLAACAMRTKSMGNLLRECGLEAPAGEVFPEGDILCKIVRREDMQAEELTEGYRVINDVETFKIKLDTCVIDDKVKEYLQNRFDYRYPHEILQKLYPKTTVSELKMAAIRDMAGNAAAKLPGEEEEGEKHLFEEEVQTPYLPWFLRGEEEKEEISGAARGSAVHRVMELMDFGRASRESRPVAKEQTQGQSGLNPEGMSENVWRYQYGREQLKADLDAWQEAGLLSEEYRKAVNPGKILRFMESPMAERMRLAAKAGKLWKEQPFMLGISADRLSPEFPDTEEILVQGIIDVFFEEDDGIVLLDYKTDVIKTPGELADRYRVQLDYYGEALGRMTGKRVKERVLYSFYLGTEVPV